MKPLNERQKRMLDFIIRHVNEKGYPPSVREAGEAAGLASSSTAHSNLRALEAHGLIRIDPILSRGIVLVGAEEDPAEAFNRHLRGLVAAMHGPDLWETLSEEARLDLQDRARVLIGRYKTILRAA